MHSTRVARNPVTGEWSQPHAVSRSDDPSAGLVLIDGQLARLGGESIPLTAISSIFVNSRCHPIAGIVLGSFAVSTLYTCWTIFSSSIGWWIAGIFLLTSTIGCFLPRSSLTINLNSGRTLTIACRNQQQAMQGRRELENALIERPQRVTR